MTDLRLVRRPGSSDLPPALDSAQREVVTHAGGPLLVQAGPGTGKTTTIVEAVRDVVRRGLAAENVLVLAFSRRAAAELRARITARLGGTTREPAALTFHSYAFGLVRRALSGEGGVSDVPHAPRILSGPEHLLAVRTLLRGQLDDGSGGWPDDLRAALGTRGFAAQVRDLMLRAQERGQGPADLVAAGELAGRPGWVATGRLMADYAARFDLDPTGPALDYAELVQRAAAVLESGLPVGEAERAQRRAVFVDEYQDTDPAQERMLSALAGDGRHLVVVGDPDQSIYGFRGASAENILRFPERFATAAGPAPTVALEVCRRSGSRLLSVSRAVAEPLPVPPAARQHRRLTADPRLPPGDVRAILADSGAAEAAAVADVLRRAHLLDGIPWSDMAVLVRSTRQHGPVLRRALAAAEVPVTVAGDEVPLAREPIVQALTQVLRVALRPEEVTEQTAEDVLLGPVVRADTVQLRRLRRALRESERESERETAREAISRRPRAGDLLSRAVREPALAAAVHARLREPLDRVHRLVSAASRAAESGSVEDVLWAVWSESGLAERYRAASLSGGARAAVADRGLDAAAALFDAAARFTDRLPAADPLTFLDDLAAQEIPGDPLTEGAVATQAVRLLTAHRSKGLEWRLVVVCGVQEGRWPDTRSRSTVLGADELPEALAGPAGPPGQRHLDRVREERRLFYVAVSRAKEQLVVTAVGAGPDSDERPSRFFDEVVAAAAIQVRPAGGQPPLSMSGVVARLRSVVVDGSQDDAYRGLAARQLARLAAAGVRGAAPGEWYAMSGLSDERPVLDPTAEVRVSPSRLEAFLRCPRRWFLESAVGARGQGSAAQTTGLLVHALAALVTDVGPTGRAEVERVLLHRLDLAWPSVDLGPAWYQNHQLRRVVEQVRRFAAWHAGTGRDLLAVELPFRVQHGRAVVAGKVDRLERDEHGRGVVTDLKTGRSQPAAGDLPAHPQLAMYQLAVQEGGFADYGVTVPGGAALVVLSGGRSAKTLAQAPLSDAEDPGWAHALLSRATEAMSRADFAARPNPGCRTCPVATSCPALPEGMQVSS